MHSSWAGGSQGSFLRVVNTSALQDESEFSRLRKFLIEGMS